LGLVRMVASEVRALQLSSMSSNIARKWHSGCAVQYVTCRDTAHDGSLHFFNKLAYLTACVETLSRVATPKIRQQVGDTINMPNLHTVTAGSGQE